MKLSRRARRKMKLVLRAYFREKRRRLRAQRRARDAELALAGDAARRLRDPVGLRDPDWKGAIPFSVSSGAPWDGKTKSAQ